jgi:Spy/CpxP family protein refolding chaperone
MNRYLKLFTYLMIGFFIISCGRGKRWNSEKIANKIVKHVSSELKLNDSQKKQLEEIKTGYLEKKKTHRKNTKGERMKLMEMVKKDSIDKNQVSEIYSKMDKSKAETREWLTDQLIEFHKTLSPEQKEKLVSMMEKYMAKKNKHYSKE